MPGNDVALTAVFEEVFEVTLTDATTLDGETFYAAGDVVTLVADDPAAGSYFDEWTIPGVSAFLQGTSLTTPTIVFAMPAAPVTATATYGTRGVGELLITTTIVGNGFVKGPRVATEDALVELTATPLEGYEFKEWTVCDLDECDDSDFDETNPVLSFAMPDADVALTATFVKASYGITVTSAPAAGAATIIIDSKTATSGTAVLVEFGKSDVDVVVTEAIGYAFVDWTGAGTDLVSSNLTEKTAVIAEMPAAAVALSANFIQLTYDIANVEIIGDAACLTSTVTGKTTGLFYGEAVELTANAVSTDVTVSCKFEGIGTSFTGIAAGDFDLATPGKIKFSMPANNIVEFQAKFVEIPPLTPYTITKGTITGLGKIMVSVNGATADSLGATRGVFEGDAVVFTVVPRCDNDAISLTVGATTIDAAPFTSTIASISANVTVSAEFTNIACPVAPPGKLPVTPPSSAYSVSISSTEGGTAYADKVTAASGSRVTLTATPSAGYRLKEWIVKSGNFSIANRLAPIATFTMPSSSVSIEAVFEIDNSYAITVTSTAGGTASASASAATYQTLVTLTATPSQGFRFKEWTVKTGGDVVFSRATDASAKFTMPPRAVAIEAVFEDLSISPTITRAPAYGSVMASAVNGGILLQNLPKNAKVEVYSLQGKLVRSANSENSQTLKIQMSTGMYIVKVNGNAMRIAVK
jgi:hypothetical protein